MSMPDSLLTQLTEKGEACSAKFTPSQVLEAANVSELIGSEHYNAAIVAEGQQVVDSVSAFIVFSGITADQLRSDSSIKSGGADGSGKAFLFKYLGASAVAMMCGLCPPSADQPAGISPDQRQALLEGWQNLVAKITNFKGREADVASERPAFATGSSTAEQVDAIEKALQDQLPDATSTVISALTRAAAERVQREMHTELKPSESAILAHVIKRANHKIAALPAV